VAELVVDTIPALKSDVTKKHLKLLEKRLSEVSGLSVNVLPGQLDMSQPNMSFTLSDFGNLSLKQLRDVMEVIELMVAKYWSQNGTCMVILKDSTVVERFETNVTKPGL
jgi:hypothetical protein